jgi:hypothetical protein
MHGTGNLTRASADVMWKLAKEPSSATMADVKTLFYEAHFKRRRRFFHSFENGQKKMPLHDSDDDDFDDDNMKGVSLNDASTVVIATQSIVPVRDNVILVITNKMLFFFQLF